MIHSEKCQSFFWCRNLISGLKPLRTHCFRLQGRVECTWLWKHKWELWNEMESKNWNTRILKAEIKMMGRYHTLHGFKLQVWITWILSSNFRVATHQHASFTGTSPSTEIYICYQKHAGKMIFVLPSFAYDFRGCFWICIFFTKFFGIFRTQLQEFAFELLKAFLYLSHHNEGAMWMSLSSNKTW